MRHDFNSPKGRCRKPTMNIWWDAAEQAGFARVRLLTLTLPMVLEGGVEQAVRAFAGMPVSCGVDALPRGTRNAFFACLRDQMAELQVDGKIVGETASNIIIATP